MPTGNRCLELLRYMKLIFSRLQGTSWKLGSLPVINRSWDWFFQVRMWCHCLSCFSAALLRNRAHFGGSEEEKKLFNCLPEESEGWVLLIKGNNCRHFSTGGSAHCPTRLANNFGRHSRQELRQWVGTQTEVDLMVTIGWVTLLKSKGLRMCVQ